LGVLWGKGAVWGYIGVLWVKYDSMYEQKSVQSFFWGYGLTANRWRGGGVLGRAYYGGFWG